ncbi:MAG: hypothetical protein ABJR46_14090 [Tateyamaria sp.]|uniref:hypothetical protein n=1 Tax=Tateyamaria sp. TaxID=1929288 RepID=UPI00329AF361
MKEIIDDLGVAAGITSNDCEGCQTLWENPDAYGLILMDLHVSGIDASDAI